MVWSKRVVRVRASAHAGLTKRLAGGTDPLPLPGLPTESVQPVIILRRTPSVTFGFGHFSEFDRDHITTTLKTLVRTKW